jgi:membrane-associated phospholipid phosphatase
MSEFSLEAARVFSWLGGEHFYLLLMPALLWFANWSTAIKAARLMILADLVGEWIKWTLRWPRPELSLVSESSPGFVSTHAALSCGIALILAADYPRLRPWLAVWVLGVGWSRWRLGAHFPIDILGGWVLATGLAFGVMRLGKDTRWASYLSVGLGLAVLLLWPEGGEASLQRDFGMLLGLELALLQRHRGEEASPPVGLSALQGALRMLGMLALYLGLSSGSVPRMARYFALALLAGWREPSWKKNS